MTDNAYTPIYQRLFNFYKERIIKQEYLPDERIDSINKIVSRHNVSRETAKLVLSKLSEDGFIIKKAGKGSFVTYTRQIQKVWGIVIPFYSSNIEELLRLLDMEAAKMKRENRYFLHYNKPQEEMRMVGTLVREGYEAVIVVPNYDESMTAGFYRGLIQGNTMVVLVDNTMGGSFFNYVIQSYDLGVKRAFSYLIAQNDKNLLFVKNESWVGKYLVYELIEQSLLMFINRQAPERKMFIMSGLDKFDKDYIINNNIGGIISFADTDSLRITGRISMWGIKMPEEVSVVSYGNTELTQLANPAVTAVDCNYPEMARLIVSLISKNRKHRNTSQYVIQPKLIVRQT